MLSIGLVEIVVLYQGIGVGEGIMAGTNAEGFTSIGSQNRSVSKIVVVDAVKVFSTFFCI